jgi:hypothetical protein
VVFILKPCSDSYGGPKDYRPIGLTLFLLKTMERLIDRFVRGEILAFMPLHPNQHAYQAGKSVETALHQLVAQVERLLDQQETALGVFLDIEGAFNNTVYLMELPDSPLCRGCGAEDETSAHTLCGCEALASLRHVHLGCFILEDIKNVILGAIWNFNPLPLLFKALLHGQKDCIFSVDI